eukprot:g16524.t1
MGVRIASINVRSVKYTVRCISTLAYLTNVKADILFLQEGGIPHLSWYRKCLGAWTRGPSIWSRGIDCRSSGLAILLRRSNFTISQVQEVVGGRLLLADVTCKNAPLRLINVYAPAVRRERLAVLQRLPPLLATFLMDTVKDAKLLEVFSTPADGAQWRYTWSRPDGSIRSRIDFLFVSRPFSVRSTGVEPVFFSDHCLLL